MKLSVAPQVDTKLFETLEECPYCRSKDWEIFLQAPDRLTSNMGTFYLSRCKNCDLVFQNPRVRQEKIGSYYTQELGYYRPAKQERVSRLGQFKNSLLTHTLAQHFGYDHLADKNVIWQTITRPFKKKLRVQLTPCFVTDGQLLEIGCSHGERLQNLQKWGWRVWGVEMDEKAARYAQEKRGLNVENVGIEEASFSPNQFDVIIMSMVWEHLYNPFEVLKQIAVWLKPGGEFIFSIPYFNGLEFRVFKEYSYGLSLPLHTTFFNREILNQALTKAGFDKPRYFFQWVDRDLVASAQFKARETGQFWWGWLGNKIMRRILVRPFVFCLSLLNQTSRVTVLTYKQVDA